MHCHSNTNCVRNRKRVRAFDRDCAVDELTGGPSAPGIPGKPGFPVGPLKNDKRLVSTHDIKAILLTQNLPT